LVIDNRCNFILIDREESEYAARAAQRTGDRWEPGRSGAAEWVSESQPERRNGK